MSRLRTLATLERIEALRWALAARQQAGILSELQDIGRQREQLAQALQVSASASPTDHTALLALIAPAAVRTEDRLAQADRDLRLRLQIAERKLQRTRKRREHLAALAAAEQAQQARRTEQRQDEQVAEIWHAHCKGNDRWK